jgi:hypothetical protein
MKQSDFASEFDPSALKADHGLPMTNAVLKAQVEAKGAAFRVEEALGNLLANAVSPYYFAKRVCPALDELSDGQNTHLAESFRQVRNSLLKTAVIGIATTIDTVDKSEGRTRSIPHALHALKRDLTTRQALQSDGDRAAAMELLNDLLERTDINRVVSLKYVKHVRNKWAGHSSLDLTIDGWADADKSISWPILEDALVRMINIFQDFSQLVSMSEELVQFEAGLNPPQTLPGGILRLEAKLAWSGANSLSQVMRFGAQKQADAFIEALVL